MLPELEKYWKAVTDDPTNFTGWTYLLQYVDTEVRASSIHQLILRSENDNHCRNCNVVNFIRLLKRLLMNESSLDSSSQKRF